MSRNIALLALGLPIVLASGCSDSCANEPVRVAEAPGGLHSAVLFQRDCGATTGYSTQISVLEKGERLSGGGNALVADDGDGAAAASWGGPWAEVRWLGPDHLLISYDEKARLFTEARQVGKVRISYRSIARGS